MRIGEKILDIGSAVGSGLSPEAAKHLGLTTALPVAASLIDAHAGAIATVWDGDGNGDGDGDGDPRHMMAMVAMASCIARYGIAWFPR